MPIDEFIVWSSKTIFLWQVYKVPNKTLTTESFRGLGVENFVQEVIEGDRKNLSADISKPKL